jgi:hypothetical protein
MTVVICAALAASSGVRRAASTSRKVAASVMIHLMLLVHISIASTADSITAITSFLVLMAIP